MINSQLMESLSQFPLGVANTRNCSGHYKQHSLIYIVWLENNRSHCANLGNLSTQNNKEG
jgi:hypothetical protein